MRRVCHKQGRSFNPQAWAAARARLSDSKQVVGEINQGSQGTAGAIITEIKSRAAAFNCIFTFEGRAVNVDVLSLARFSLSLAPGRHVWFDQPHNPNYIPLVVDFD